MNQTQRMRRLDYYGLRYHRLGLSTLVLYVNHKLIN